MMFFYMENNRIDALKVKEYIGKKYFDIDFNEKTMSQAFERKYILDSEEEIKKFLIYLGYSKEGLNYYFENNLEQDIYYVVFTILSKSDLLNQLNGITF